MGRDDEATPSDFKAWAADAFKASPGASIATPAQGGGVSYGALSQRGPKHDAGYWAELRSFYEGGKRLLGDDALLSRVFPRHRDEEERVYRQRKARALYVSYAAEIVGKIVADLSLDPLALSTGGDAESNVWTEWYDEFFRNTAPRSGGVIRSLGDLVRGQVLEAMQVRRAWTLVELPSLDASRFSSRAEQEQAGALDAYAIPLEAECVIDWEHDTDGELEFAMLNFQDRKREGISSSRGMVRERWIWYTRTDYRIFETTYKVGEPPDERDIVPEVQSGRHSFGRVPLVELCVPCGLWAMDKLHSLAREHFNKRSALAWAEFQSLFQELYEFLAPPRTSAGVTINEAQEDSDRHISQRRGQGFVQKRGNEDDARFVGPPTDGFAHALASTKEIRDEMHRVTHQMALTVDNSGAALKRSGDSKRMDAAATTVILEAIGDLARKHANEVLSLVSVARGESQLKGKWACTGMARFDVADSTAVVEEGQGVKLLEIKSETFQRRYQLKVAKAVLPDESPETIQKIEEELENNITSELMEESDNADTMASKAMRPADDEGDDEDSAGDDEGDGEGA